ncbi:MAG: Ubiquinone biosynthesis O-methyltransferase [Candidatus Heimdallarchaeota archaeon LC_2]|nr:MAG: Ubiquinone biosynthesis O-methyltransferase [Candidatus Heimdallarchaeota archaeon LC_2]
MKSNGREVNMSEEVKQKAGKLLTDMAGFISTRTMAMGLELELFQELTNHPNGITVDDLAKLKNLDPFYLGVWCKSAYGSELLESNGNSKYTLAPHIETLLLNRDFPGYIGGIPKVFTSAEMFDTFPANMQSGKRTWWDKLSPNWIKSVIETTRPMYTRFLNVGIGKVPGLEEKMQNGHIMELASGAGDGLTRTALKYPNSTFVGVDGDEFSIKLAEEATSKLNLSNRVKYHKSTFEDIDYKDEFDVVTINASMHECRDLDKVTTNVLKSLKSGGSFVISDFPYPAGLDGLRTIPGRIMTGIQFFESQIDDLLMPTQDFVDLLNKNGFREVGAFDISPTHNVIYGTN